MAADPNIFQQYLKAPKSVAEYSDDLDKSALSDIQLRQARQGESDSNALRKAAQSFGSDAESNYRAILATGNVNAANAYRKNNAELAKTQAESDKLKAGTAETSQDTKGKAFEYYKNVLGTVQDPTQARNFVMHSYTDPTVGPELQKYGSLDEMLAKMPTDPAGFQQWKANAAIGIQKLAEMSKVNQVNQGDRTTTQLVNPATGQVQNVATATVNQSPDSIASNATSRANNAATIGAENTRAQLGRETQLKVAGYDANGNMLGATDGGGIAGLVDAIGTGKVPQATALSRMPAAMKSQVLTGLAEKYPDYDPTDMAQRNRAAVAFGTGKEGNSVRSFNVSLSHLDTLSNLADALGNGNIQLLNKAKNIYQQQTGSAAPTDFEAAKKIVTDEIVKAIVGTGGGVHDREAAADTIAKASSPAQLKGVINTYKELMNGQLGGLERQYEATTGRKDFRTKFLSPQAQAQAGGVNADLHSAADAILAGKK